MTCNLIFMLYNHLQDIHELLSVATLSTATTQQFHTIVCKLKQGIAKMYEHIVVGAGVNGLSAAYQLAKRGKKVLLLEKVNIIGIVIL